YSMAVAPSSSFHNLINVANIQALLWPLTFSRCAPKLAKPLTATGPTMPQSIQSHKTIAIAGLPKHYRQKPVGSPHASVALQGSCVTYSASAALRRHVNPPTQERRADCTRSPVAGFATA